MLLFHCLVVFALEIIINRRPASPSKDYRKEKAVEIWEDLITGFVPLTSPRFVWLLLIEILRSQGWKECCTAVLLCSASCHHVMSFA